MKKDESIKEELINMACSWVSLAFPWVSSLKESKESIQSISDKVLFNKLAFVLSNQDSNFNEWLKISEKFNEDNKAYLKMVKKLIYYINAMNEEELLSAFSNLLRAYKDGLICKNDFFRLGFCLTKLLAEDAKYLVDNIKKEKIEENIYCISLSNIGLMYNKSRGFSENDDDVEIEFYCFTQMGKMLDKYALNYRNTDRYQYEEPDSSLAEQKLTYNQNKSVRWSTF